MGASTAGDTTCLRLLLITDWISRREDAVVYRTRLSNEARSFAIRL